jgi:polar amino acid transport system substrate-binding protein
MLRTVKRLALAAGILALGMGVAKAEDVLAKIKSTGKFIVGIKVDYRPFGFRNEKGDMVGLEHDLVADIADRLSKTLGRKVELEKIPVTAQNRMQFLQQGRIDFLMATMNVTPEREKLLDIIHPAYYASGVNLLTRKSSTIAQWSDLKGKTVCTMQGAWYNKPLTEKYGFTANPYAGVAEAVQAAFDNRCVGFLDDDSHAAGLLQRGGQWADFHMPLKTLDEAPWGAAIRKGDPKFEKFLSDTITDWHRKGTILALQKKWHIAPTPWVQMMHEKYKAK